MIYLGIKYSGSEDKSFEKVNKAAFWLIKHKYLVYSPISQTHHMVGGKEQEFDFWIEHDIRMLNHCTTLVIVYTDDWMNSKGLAKEIEHAKANSIPILFVVENDDENYEFIDLPEAIRRTPSDDTDY